MTYIFSQIFVCFSYLFLGSTYFLKNRKNILIFNFISLLLYGTAYFLLGAWSGLAMMGVAIVRNIVFLVQSKLGKSSKITYVDWLVLGFFAALSTLLAVLTFDGFGSLLSVFATFTYTVSIWQKNPFVYKIMGIIASILWIAYSIYIMSVFGIVLEVVLLIVVIVGTIKYKKDTKKSSENTGMVEE